MNRLLILLLLVVYSCTPKLATNKTTEDYSEDVSDFRPKIETMERVDEEKAINDKGAYVPPTHDINNEMASIMDSVVVHNLDKMYLTYTIQVYIGRSREEANQIREKVYRVLPEEKPILVYKQPSYKVNVGKYNERIDAYQTLTALRAFFPGAMLVPERNHIE